MEEEETLPRFLDGPKFIEWLVEEEGVKFAELTESQKRRWHDWKSGCRADLYSGAVDQIMTDYLLSSRLIPDHCWSVDQRNRNAGKTKRTHAERRQIRAEGRMLLAAGVHEKQIAKRLDVSRSTVRTWRRNQDLEALAA